LDSTVLMGPFQLEIFYDPMIPQSSLQCGSSLSPFPLLTHPTLPSLTATLFFRKGKFSPQQSPIPPSIPSNFSKFASKPVAHVHFHKPGLEPIQISKAGGVEIQPHSLLTVPTPLFFLQILYYFSMFYKLG